MLIEILTWIFTFAVGAFVGAFIKSMFRRYSGTIVVNKDDIADKTVYSLVLDDYPEKLEFKKAVVFKVDISDQSPDRK